MNFEEKILDSLSETLEGNLSINQLSKELKNEGLSADYKNTYEKILELEEQGIIETKRIGKSRTISLNYSSPKTIARLAMIELSKKIEFLEKAPNFTPFNAEITNIEAEFIAIINPQKNFSLNRLELLILTNEPKQAMKRCEELQNKFSIKIDCLGLKEKDYLDLLKKENLTLVNMLSNRIILSGQENFYERTGKIINEKSIKRKEYSLTDLNENEIRYNLSKFGYSEFGTEDSSKKLSIEETIASTLLNGTARQRKGLETTLEKNDFSAELLEFLSKKYSKQKELLKILKGIKSKTNTNINKTKELISLAGEAKW
jgi:hypothetical protein